MRCHLKQTHKSWSVDETFLAKFFGASSTVPKQDKEGLHIQFSVTGHTVGKTDGEAHEALKEISDGL